jgi:hypothetical protein
MDIIIPFVKDLFWIRSGSGGLLYMGPILAPMSSRYARPEEKLLEPVVVLSVVPDDLSSLWIWRQSEFQAVTVKDHLCALPLRFRGLVYEEGVSRAKNYLVDRLFGELRPEQRVNVTWELIQDTWTLWVGTGSIGFPSIQVEGNDPYRALAEAVALTDEES